MDAGRRWTTRISQPLRERWLEWRHFGPARAARRANRATIAAEYTVSLPEIRTPIIVRSSETDYRILRQTIGRRESDVRLPSPPEFIIDAGANVGYSSLWFANRWPQARILAVEPDARNCAQFRRNLAEYPQVTLCPGALWPRPATLEILNPDDGSCNFRVEERALDQATSGIRGFTIPELLQRAGVDRVGLLKIDIEGAEVEVLAEAHQWLDQVDTLMIELHERFRPGCEAVLRAAVAGRDAHYARQGEFDVFHFARAARPQILTMPLSGQRRSA